MATYDLTIKTTKVVRVQAENIAEATKQFEEGIILKVKKVNNACTQSACIGEIHTGLHCPDHCIAEVK